MSVTVATQDDLEELRAELRAAIERISMLERERVRVEKPPLEWISAKKFAARRGLSVRTVAKLIGEGMPSEKIGRARRVEVVAAEQWIATRSAQ